MTTSTRKDQPPAPDKPAAARFGIAVDSDNGHHVRFRLFAATGGEHLGHCGQLVMRPEEYAAFRTLLAPALTDRPDPSPAADPCGRCKRPFDPADKTHNGRARYGDTAFCRGCVDRCHESTDFAHECVICR